jgi:hypothetical protein
MSRPTTYHVSVPPMLHGLLQLAAQRERTTVPVLVVRLLRDYLREEHPDLHRHSLVGRYAEPAREARSAPGDDKDPK